MLSSRSVRCIQGNVDAQVAAGDLLLKGQVVPKDLAEAAKWFRMAAEQGDPQAQNNLGTMCDQGDGVDKDQAEAVRWFRAAAEQGHVIAQYNLGSMYEHGDGVLADGPEAVDWYHAAGNQGYYRACMALAQMYEEGRQGVPLDNAFAFIWYLAAFREAENEDDKQLADDACDRVLAKATPEQMKGMVDAYRKGAK
jgi:TPR repeat protein